MQRDFTYINDIVEGILRVALNPPKPNDAWLASTSDASSSSAPYKVYNIGNNAPVKLTDFIAAAEKELGVTAIKQLMPLQPGDVPATYANVDDLVRDMDYKPATTVEHGIKMFIKWYTDYYNNGSLIQ
jgi:UDP-glucuronate 4-epimerase